MELTALLPGGKNVHAHAQRTDTLFHHIVLRNDVGEVRLVINFRGVPYKALLGLAASLGMNRGLPELGQDVYTGPARADNPSFKEAPIYTLCSLRPIFLQVGGTCWYAAAVNMLIHCPVMFALLSRRYREKRAEGKSVGAFEQIFQRLSDGTSFCEQAYNTASYTDAARAQLQLPTTPDELEDRRYQRKFGRSIGYVPRYIALGHVFEKLLRPMNITWSIPGVRQTFSTKHALGEKDVRVRKCPVDRAKLANGTHTLCSVYIVLTVRRAEGDDQTHHHAICGIMLREPGCSPATNPLQLIIDSNGIIVEYDWVSAITAKADGTALLEHLRTINSMYLMYDRLKYVSVLFARNDHVAKAAEEARLAPPVVGGDASRPPGRPMALLAGVVSTLVCIAAALIPRGA